MSVFCGVTLPAKASSPAADARDAGLEALAGRESLYRYRILLYLAGISIHIISSHF
jgi:hypothetical protein